MWPALSMTKPEPSAVCFCVWGPKPNSGSAGVLTTWVEVTWTTPGASRRKMSFTERAPLLDPLRSNAAGEPVAAPPICSTVVVVAPKPNAAAPARASAPPARPAPSNAPTESRLRRPMTAL